MNCLLLHFKMEMEERKKHSKLVNKESRYVLETKIKMERKRMKINSNKEKGRIFRSGADPTS